jgi:transcription elongation factor Elf1
MTNTNSRKLPRRIACPQCGEVGLQKIIYGMPSDDFNFDKYIVGGCIVSEANIGCTNCEWSGTRNELEQS